MTSLVGVADNLERCRGVPHRVFLTASHPSFLSFMGAGLTEPGSPQSTRLRDSSREITDAEL